MEPVPGPFRADEALARGRITRGRPAGPTVTRLLPSVHALADQVPTTPEERARAAVLYVRGTPPVVGGLAAAELLGLICGPRDAPVELVVGARRVRPVGRRGCLGLGDVVAASDPRSASLPETLTAEPAACGRVTVPWTGDDLVHPASSSDDSSRPWRAAVSR